MNKSYFNRFWTVGIYISLCWYCVVNKTTWHCYHVTPVIRVAQSTPVLKSEMIWSTNNQQKALYWVRTYHRAKFLRERYILHQVCLNFFTVVWATKIFSMWFSWQNNYDQYFMITLSTSDEHYDRFYSSLTWRLDLEWMKKEKKGKQLRVCSLHLVYFSTTSIRQNSEKRNVPQWTKLPFFRCVFDQSLLIRIWDLAVRYNQKEGYMRTLFT